MFVLAKPNQPFSSQHRLWTVLSAQERLGVMIWLEHLKLQITLNKCLVEPQFENLGLRFPLWEREIPYRLLTTDFAKRVNRFPVGFPPVQFCQQPEHLGAHMSGQTVSESGIRSHSLTLLTSRRSSKGLIFELLSLCICTHRNISLYKGLGESMRKLFLQITKAAGLNTWKWNSRCKHPMEEIWAQVKIVCP